MLHLKLSITINITIFIRFYLEKFICEIRQKFVKIFNSI